MSESTLAIDHAWSVVKGDPDKIEKILPLLVPAALAGYGGYQAYRNVKDNKITDPFLGVKVAEGDDPRLNPQGATALQIATGLSQGLGAGAGVKLGAKLGGKFATKRGGAIAAQRQAARDAAEQATISRVARAQADEAGRSLGPAAAANADARLMALARNQPYTQRMGREAGTQAARRGSMRQGAYDRMAAGAGKIDDAIPLGRTAAFGAGLGTLGALGLAGANYAADKFGNLFGGGQGSQQLESGFGQGQQYDAFGSGGLGVNDISNVQGNAVADRQIFDPNAYISDPRAVGFEAQGEFGGFGKGDIMFVNRTGNEIKKQVEEMMYKAKCSACDKEDCLGKMHCGTMKADDKKDKKPAHGMVIVIGSKAGPGPSKDGKREKLDSEKKEE